MSEISAKQQAHDLAITLVSKIVTDPTNATEVAQNYIKLYNSYLDALIDAADNEFVVQA